MMAWTLNFSFITYWDASKKCAQLNIGNRYQNIHRNNKLIVKLFVTVNWKVLPIFVACS